MTTCNNCYGRAFLVLQVIKVDAKGGTVNFCEMLQVKLHLLWLLQNLITALFMVRGAKPLVTTLYARVAGILAEYCEW